MNMRKRKLWNLARRQTDRRNSRSGKNAEDNFKREVKRNKTKIVGRKNGGGVGRKN